MDSSSILTQSFDGCINQHHEMECSDFDIIEADSIDVSMTSQIENDSQITEYISLSNEIQQEKEEEKEEDIPTTPLNEIKIMFKLAVPVCITSISRVVMWNTDQIFLGHLGTQQLAGASLADTCMEILTMFVYTPAWSLNGLCSQALGTGQHIMVGYWLQLTIIICTIITIPVSIGYFYISDLINIVSHDNNVVEYSKEFAHYAVLFLWTNAMLACIRLFHQSLEIVNPFTMISMIAIILNIFGNILWIHGLNITIFEWKIRFNGLNFIGSPLATSTSMMLQLIMYYLWCFKWKRYHLLHKTWNGWSLRQTILNKKRVKEFMKVVVPLTVSNASENWAYQVIILYAATLDAAEISAMACTFAVWGILWSFYSGIGAAIITRVGKKIGSGNIKEAKMVSKIGLFLSFTVCTMIATIIFILSDKVAMIYSNDKEVIMIMKQSVRALCITYVIGGIGWCAMNILESMSKNKIKGIINVLTAWFGYVPLCIFFMSKDHHKLIGVSPVSCIFVIGMLVEMIRSIALWIMVFITDWEKASIEAQERNDKYDELVRNEINEEKEEMEEENKCDDGNALKSVLLDSQKK